MVKVNKLKRIFEFNGTLLPDPNPELSTEEIKNLYAATYPELTNAAIKGPRITAESEKYIFIEQFGDKG